MDSTDAGPDTHGETAGPSGTSAVSASPPPSTDYLRWPPPGLERLQGDLWRIIRELFVGGFILVLPLLWAVGETQPFYSSGPFGEAWWILLLTTFVGLLVLITAFIDTFRLLRRSARATDRGYGWKTVVIAAVDADRDMGFLLQAGRAYSVLQPGMRHTLIHARLWAAGTWLAAAFWLPAGFILAVLLASRGVMSAPVLVLFTLVPPAFLLVMGSIFKSWERGVLRRARREWHKKPWSQDLEQEEIRGWHADLTRRDSTEDLEDSGASRAGTVLRASSFGIAVLALFVVLPSVVMVVSSSISPILALIAVPNFSRTQQRAAQSEALWRYRIEVDPAVTPQEAGDILHALTKAGRPELAELEKEPVRIYEEDFLSDDDYRDNPTGMDPGLWPGKLFPALDTVGPEAVAFLRGVAEHPAFAELSALAKAESLDAASARWRTPFPEDLTAVSFPIPRMSGLREAAYAAVARAAVATLDGRDEDAERTLREVVTFGLLLGRDGTTLIDNLVGYVIAEAGGEGLAGFYRATGRVGEAESLEWSMDVAARSAKKAQSGWSSSAFGALRAMPDVVLDTTAIRGLRWEFFITLNSIAPCMNVNRVVFGPEDSFTRWREEAHASLVMFPSEEPVYDLLSRGWLGTLRDDPPRSFLGKLFTITMGGEGPGSCARMFEDLSSAGMLN